MEGLAKDVLDKKTVSAEQSAEILGWLVLNFLTMKRSLWSENKLAEKIQAAIDAHKEKCDAEDGAVDGTVSKKSIAMKALNVLFSERGLLFVIIVMLIIYIAARDGVHYGDEAGRFKSPQATEAGK